MKKHLLTIGFALLLFASRMPAQDASGIHVICSNVIKSAIDKLVPQFERASGKRVILKYGASAELKTAIEKGARFDLVLLTTGVVDDLIKQGSIAPGTRTDIAESNLGVGARANAPDAETSTPEAMKRLLLGAKSITYSKAGGGVPAILRMIRELGIAEQIQSKTFPQDAAGRAGESVAKGEYELAFAPVTEIIEARGAKVLGLFPAQFQSPLAISSGIASQATDRAGAVALAKFLVTPESMKAIEASGMTLTRTAR
jgi:molybdate transport system substrate-binding protein